MSEALVVREATDIERPVELGLLRANDAKALVSSATDLASSLADVIKKQRLFSTIQGRRYVQCEGWTTLAAMLGVTPREVESRELEDGGYEAVVELARVKDGAVVGRASAICGGDEPLWAKRSKYARKSMAATRATGKACRMSFSWIMALAGYEVTPAEEIPDERPDTRPPPHFDIQSDHIEPPPQAEKKRTTTRRKAEAKKEDPPPVEETPPPREDDEDDAKPIGPEDVKEFWACARANTKSEEKARGIASLICRILGIRMTSEMTRAQYDKAIATLKNQELPADWQEIADKLPKVKEDF
jgi:hypothetical protein